MSLQKALTVARMASARGLISSTNKAIVMPQRNFLISTPPRNKTNPAVVFGVCTIFSISVCIVPAYISLHLKEYGR